MGRNKKTVSTSITKEQLPEAAQQLINQTFEQLDPEEQKKYAEIFDDLKKYKPPAHRQTFEIPQDEHKRWTPRRSNPLISKQQYSRQVLLDEYKNGGTAQTAHERLKREIGLKTMSIEVICRWFDRFESGDLDIYNRYNTRQTNTIKLQKTQSEQETLSDDKTQSTE